MYPATDDFSEYLKDKAEEVFGDSVRQLVISEMNRELPPLVGKVIADYIKTDIRNGLAAALVSYAKEHPDKSFDEVLSELKAEVRQP